MSELDAALAAIEESAKLVLDPLYAQDYKAVNMREKVLNLAVRSLQERAFNDGNSGEEIIRRARLFISFLAKG